MAMIRKIIDLHQPVPAEILEEIEEASRMPVVPDDDCPELTESQLMKFSAIAKKQREHRKMNMVSLQLSSSAIEKAQKLGKGYTVILSRIIENALNNPEILKKCL